MAVAQLGVGMRMNNDQVWEPNPDVEPQFSNASASGFTITVPGRVFTILGSGFTYKNGDAVGGNANQITMRSGSETLFDVAGLNASFANDFFDSTYGGEQPGWQSELAYWLRENDTLNGAAGDEYLKAFGGNDQIFGKAGNDVIDGGGGTDTAQFSTKLSESTVARMSSQMTVSGSDGIDQLLAIERLSFSDGSVAFDSEGNAGQVYRLYKAAFARQPDLGGLGSWIEGRDAGQSLEQIAAAFAGSAEFQALYGSTTSNEQFVKLLYLNALGRAPEAGGVPGWASQLATGAITRAQLLAQFSESTENKAAVQSKIADGILYAQGSQTSLANQGLTLTGDSGANTLYGSVGKDKLTGGAGNDSLKGGAGIDTAIYSAARSAYTLSGSLTELNVGSAADGQDTLSDVERLQFTDKILAFDISGNAGQVYRLYQAAFDRTPDVAGLTDWIRGMDNGLTLRNVAAGFIGSDEFKAKYGANPSDDAFVTLLYQNVLNRAPDDGGKAYWLDELNRGMTREMALIGFSESTENQAAVIGVIQSGIELIIG